MQHEEFAERVAGRLQAMAVAIEEEGEDRQAGRGTVSARANEMRVAARMVRDMAETVTRAEKNRPLEEEKRAREYETRSEAERTNEVVETGKKEVVLL